MIFEKIRKAIKNTYKKYIVTDGDLEWNRAIYKCETIVAEVQAEYNNGWIYCSSGQIPKDDDYILYCGNHLANMEVDCCIGEWFLNHLEYMLAWQPLPYPPKGE